MLTRREFLGRSAAIGAAALAAGPLARAAEETAKSEWRVGIYTRPWAAYDYRVAFDAMAEAGFKYAGLMTAKAPAGLIISPNTTHGQAHEVATEAQKRGLKILSAWGGGIPVDQSVDQGISALKRLIDNCSVAGVASLLLGGTSEKLYDAYYKAIAECCGYAAEKQIELVLKPHGGTNATGPQCRKAVETVGHKNFRLWYDPGNIYYYSQGALNPVDDAPTVDGLVTGMCVKDFTKTNGPDGKPVLDVNVTPGEGLVDFPAVMKRLKAGGFRGGSMVIETIKQGDEKTLIAEAKKAREFIEQLVGA